MRRTASNPDSHPPLPHEIWIVVADSGRARIFSGAAADGSLAELEDLLDPDARLQEHDVTADRKGHVARGAGGSSFEPRHTHAENHAERFAKQVCDRLAAARKEGRLARIYLIAAPAFLGHLRTHMDPETKRLVREEIASDLTQRTAAAIRAALPAHL